MKNYKLSPSIYVSNLLEVGKEIKQLDAAGADMYHIDIIDTTFAKTSGCPASILPAIREISSTPFDVHLMTSVPEDYFPLILPYCKDSFVVIHIEVAKEMNWLAYEIRKAGAKPGIAINSSTPTYLAKEIIPMIDMVQIMLCDAGREMKIPGLKERMYPKIAEVKDMCNASSRDDMVIQCDGGITFEMAKQLLKLGANSFVLGRDSIFAQAKPSGEKLLEMREYLNII